MHKLLPLLYSLFVVNFLYGQEDASKHEFAIVYLPNEYSAGVDYWIYYDNGDKEDLTKILNLETLKNGFQMNKNVAYTRDSEFKILEYMYNH